MSRNNKNHSSKIIQNNSSHQSLFLWTSFLLGMISLGIIVWQRSSGSVMSNNSVIRNDKAFTLEDNFVITYSTPLILSALSYQLSGSAMTGLLVGLGSYITQIKAQVTVPAITINLADLKQGEGVILTGASSGSVRVFTADVNRDNKIDLLIGAVDAKTVYLIYGSAFNNTMNLDALSGAQGVIFVGGQYTGQGLYAADMNQDGTMDLLIGAFGANKVYLVYGPNFGQATNLDALNVNQGITFTGAMSSGCDVFASNITGDGNIDLLIGAYDATSKAYLVYGPNFANATNLNALNANQGLTFTGAYGTGSPVLSTDMNNDGFMDLLIGDLYSNKVYLAYGPNFTEVTNLETLSGNRGVIFTGGAHAGIAICAADVNHDGFMDLLIGTRNANRVYLVYGPNFANATNLDNLTAAQGIIFTASSGIGESIRVADINGDGIVDLLIGGDFGTNSAGTRAYLVYGPNLINAANLDTLNLTQGVTFLAGAIVTVVDAADFDGDGKLDVMIGSTTTKVYIVYNHVFNVFPPVTTTTPSPTTTSTTTILQETKNILTSTSTSVTRSNIPPTQPTVSIDTTSTSTSTTKVAPAENSNTTSDIIGAAAGACVVGALMGAAGFFAAVKACHRS
jgi:hypothetical protein